MTEKALVVLSGGQDSTTCLYYAKSLGYDEIHAVTFDYGQHHAREIECASIVAAKADIESHEIIKIGDGVLAGTSPLINKGKNLEQYKDWYSLPGGLEKTFVPNRNALFIVLAVNRAFVKGINNIYLGVCQEDFGGYPDCRRIFIDAMTVAMSLSNDFGVKLHTPLMDLTKAESVLLAKELPSCYEALAYTQTGYDGAYPPTGKDHATLLRAKGFEQADLPDPLVVRAHKEGLRTLPESSNYRTERSQRGSASAASANPRKK